jgi:hypothetical protein
MPADPTVHAALLAPLDRGIAEARAGRDVAWEDLDRRTRAKYDLPREGQRVWRAGKTAPTS